MMVESRRTDLTPIYCNKCGWRGQVKDCIHGYEHSQAEQDVNPMDYCPNCESAELIPIEEELVPV